MKSMGIDAVVNFPFPSQPDRSKLAQAEKILVHLGALKEETKGDARITDLGRSMSLFPLAPRYAKMLALGKQHGCLPYVIAIVSALSIGDPFLPEESLFGPNTEDENEEDQAEQNNAQTAASEQRRQTRKAYFAAKEVCNCNSHLIRC
jgi:ATP-dependent RNA helicase DHX37/DHR1